MPDARPPFGARDVLLERAIARSLRRRPVTRRRFLQGSVLAGTAATLAACGIAGQSPAPATPGATGTPGTAPTGTPATTSPAEPVGQLIFANWPLYIDIDEETGEYPTLQKFTAESGIRVTYQEDIADNEEFFGRIQPDLAAGNPTGYDLIAPTDWMIERLIRLGYLEELDHSRLPAVFANMQDIYRDPWYDPGNRYSVPWVAGSVGIGYNPELTGREITTFDDLLDPQFAGRVGMFSEMRDTMCLAILSLGIDAATATVDDARRAQEKLLEAAERGQFRAFYGNEYYDQLAAGNLAITMAWGGDVSQMKLYDNDAVEFVIPDSGGMLYVDNMCIPKNTAAIVDAHMMMDFWYELENAVSLIEYIGFFSPVEGVPEQVLENAQTARDEGDDEWADILEVIAETAVPSPEMLERLNSYPLLDEQEERAWNDLFNEVVAG